MAMKIENKKKNKNKINSTQAHYNEDVVKIVKILSIVIICFTIVYFATAIINGELGGSKKAEEVEIQNEEILITETFVKTDKEYMIIYYDFNDKMYAGLYDMIVDNYKASKDAISMYRVDLSSKLSERYISEKSNTNPTSLENLKITGATLIRFKDNKVTKYVEGKDNIKNYIDELVK